MKWIALLTYPFFLPLTFSSALGQSEAYKLFEQLKFEEVRTELANLPPTPYNIYLANLNDCADLILNEGRERYKRLNKEYDNRLDLLKDLDESAEKNAMLGEIRLQWAFIAGKYGDNWSAFWTLRKAQRTIEKNIDEYPHHMPNLRTIGLINIVLDLVPDNRKWLLNVFGMKGNFELGYEQLSQAETNENKNILALINTYILEEKVKTEFPNDKALYYYLGGLINSKQHHAQAAIQSFQLLSDKIAVRPYLLAEAHFNNGDFENAIPLYLAFLNNEEFINYKKDAYLKLALAHWFSGQNEILALEFLEKARTIDKTDTEIDRNAARLINQVTSMNKNLLMLRYSLDGGNFNKALDLINELEKEEISDYERLEFTYRKARYFQLSNQTEKAISEFKIVISQGEAFREAYFVPNSYLQIAKIYEQIDQSGEARMYYNRVLDFEDHTYKQSIDLKARIALTKLDRTND